MKNLNIFKVRFSRVITLKGTDMIKKLLTTMGIIVLFHTITSHATADPIVLVNMVEYFNGSQPASLQVLNLVDPEEIELPIWVNDPKPGDIDPVSTVVVFNNQLVSIKNYWLNNAISNGFLKLKGMVATDLLAAIAPDATAVSRNDVGAVFNQIPGFQGYGSGDGQSTPPPSQIGITLDIVIEGYGYVYIDGVLVQVTAWSLYGLLNSGAVRQVVIKGCCI